MLDIKITLGMGGIGCQPKIDRKKIAIERNNLPLTTETVKKWSQIIKPDEIKFLQLGKEIYPRRVAFSDGKYIFDLYILPDGRFYMISPLDDRKPSNQMRAHFMLMYLKCSLNTL